MDKKSAALSVGAAAGVIGLILLLSKPGQAGTLSLSGKVTADNGFAIKGATVSINGKQTQSDSSGDYKFYNIEPGTYTITCSKPGYATLEEDMEIVEGTNILNITMTAIIRYGYLTGVVTDGTNPISGVKITLSGNGISETVYTAADGSYAISDIPVGTYTVTFEHDDYETVVR